MTDPQALRVQLAAIREAEARCGFIGPLESEARDAKSDECCYQALVDQGGRVIADCCNSDGIEIHSDHDDEGGRHYWDETGRRRLDYIAAAVNFLTPDNIATLESLLAGAGEPSGEIVVDGKRCVFRSAKDGPCWIGNDTGENWSTFYLGSDGAWHDALLPNVKVFDYWPTEQSARDFARQVASKGEVGRGRKTPQLHIVRRRHRKA